MAIEPINSISNITFNKIRENYANSSNKRLFAETLNNAIQNIDQSVNLTDKGIEALLSGEELDINELMINLQKTEMTLDLTLQVREKVIDAYKEIMRMQI